MLTKSALFPCPACGRDGAVADEGHAICRRCEGHKSEPKPGERTERQEGEG